MSLAPAEGSDESMTGRKWFIGIAVAVVAVVLVVTVAACGGSSTSSSSSTPSATASQSAEAQVKADWEKFFAGTTPAAEKISLLQNGDQFAGVIKAQAGQPLSQATQANVTAVKMISATEAQVTYSILMNGQVALADQTGQAVLENGSWKVGAASFQALLALEQQSQGASGSPSPTATP
jgi:hypothetical protein